MRLWSIHPKYLDAKGLVACWREALLAQEILAGRTKSYINHPQLIRFKSDRGLYLISKYLWALWNESCRRNYPFIWQKIWYREEKLQSIDDQLTVTSEQILYEFNHLQNKLRIRNNKKYFINRAMAEAIRTASESKNIIIEPHPLFVLVNGNIESWEKIK